jgi:hypothetical protein
MAFARGRHAPLETASMMRVSGEFALGQSQRMAVASSGATRRTPTRGEIAMYFGTLVTQARHEHDQEPWKRDLSALSVAPPSRWRAFCLRIARLFR